LLDTLPEAGENYMIVFKLIHDMCLGEVTSLLPSDLSLLAKLAELGEEAKGVEKEAGEGKEEEAGKGSTCCAI
jgi:hypothetical protein